MRGRMRVLEKKKQRNKRLDWKGGGGAYFFVQEKLDEQSNSQLEPSLDVQPLAYLLRRDRPSVK